VAAGPAADPHNYVTIGSGTAGWARAGIKRMLGLNLFARGGELFWQGPADMVFHVLQLILNPSWLSEITSCIP
jgi:hypothetical protein